MPLKVREVVRLLEENGGGDAVYRRKRPEMSIKRYPLIIEPTSTGFSAFSPDVPGCAAVGDTGEETRRNFQEALAAHLDVMREIGEPIPEPRTSVD